MALVGRLHPLLIHFPIALVLAALASEACVILTGRPGWRRQAIALVRSAALAAPLAALAGWRLAGDPIVDPAPPLEWHRWLSVARASRDITVPIGTPSTAAISLYDSPSISRSR